MSGGCDLASHGLPLSAYPGIFMSVHQHADQAAAEMHQNEQRPLVRASPKVEAPMKKASSEVIHLCVLGSSGHRLHQDPRGQSRPAEEQSFRSLPGDFPLHDVARPKRGRRKRLVAATFISKRGCTFQKSTL